MKWVCDGIYPVTLAVMLRVRCCFFCRFVRTVFQISAYSINFRRNVFISVAAFRKVTWSDWMLFNVNRTFQKVLRTTAPLSINWTLPFIIASSSVPALLLASCIHLDLVHDIFRTSWLTRFVSPFIEFSKWCKNIKMTGSSKQIGILSLSNHKKFFEIYFLLLQPLWWTLVLLLNVLNKFQSVSWKVNRHGLGLKEMTIESKYIIFL